MYRTYAPITKIDAEQRMVYGYASTEARDDQGEIVKRSALEKALGDYMKFANIREMHQNSAVGTAKSASVDDRGLFIGAKVIDPLAWEKVKEGVYKGFSIGGRVTERAAGDSKTITGLSLAEISLVDRPANPEAVFDCWKAADMPADPGTPATALAEALTKARAAGPVQKWIAADGSAHATKAAALKHEEGLAAEDEAKKLAAPALAAAEAFDAAVKAASLDPAPEPVAKGGDDPGDGKKPFGNVEYADPGYQSDKKKRYPIDTEEHIRAAWSYIHKKKNAAKYSAEDLAKVKAKIVAAWKKKIDKDGPPEAGKKSATATDLSKSLGDAARVAYIVQELHWIAQAVAVEAAMEGDDSGQAPKLKATLADLIAWCQAEMEEAAEEIKDGTEVDGTLVIDLAAVADTLVKAGLPVQPQGGDIAKISGELDAMKKLLGEFGERMTRGAETMTALTAENAALKAEVKKLADTPLAPRAIQIPAGLTVVEKTGQQRAALSADEARKALDALPERERAMALIHAAHQRPYRDGRTG